MLFYRYAMVALLLVGSSNILGLKQNDQKLFINLNELDIQDLTKKKKDLGIELNKAQYKKVGAREGLIVGSTLLVVGSLAGGILAHTGHGELALKSAVLGGLGVACLAVEWPRFSSAKDEEASALDEMKKIELVEKKLFAKRSEVVAE